MKAAAIALAVAIAGGAGAQGPAERYKQWCAVCHDKPADAKTPSTGAIRRMSGTRIRYALEEGQMAQYVGDLSRRQVIALAEHLAGDQETRMPESAFCASAASAQARMDRWGFDDANSRWQRRSAINAENVGSLRLQWAFAAPNVSIMRSQPAVSEDTIFLPTLAGRLYALDRERGCIRWTYRAEEPLRTSVSLGRAGAKAALFVADQGTAIHAIDAATGERIWKRDVGLFTASMATGAPVPHGNRLFVPISAFGVALAMQPDFECCKSHGGVRALDAATGEILWTTHMTPDAKPTYKNKLGVQMWGPSGAPVWTTPAIDAKRNAIYVGTGENTSSPATDMSDAIVALDMDTGAVKWHFQGTKDDAFNMACGGWSGSASCPKENGPDFDFGASVVIAKTTAGKDVLLAGQKSGAVFALDPDAEGAVLWQRRIGPGSALGGVHWGIAADQTQVYVPIADPRFVAARKPGVWALRIDDGAHVWHHDAGERFSAAASIAGDVVLAAALDGRAFALRRDDGEVLWEYATNRAFDGVNGLQGRGGAIDSPGVVAVDDQLIVPSGYNMFGQLPGNMLLVFALGD